MSEILLGVSGSAACFKAAALASTLTREGHGVQAVLTPSAARLVTPLQFASVTGRRALCDEWDPEDPAGMDHIAAARRADLLLLAPATANTLGAAAHGLAPNLLGSLVLAWESDRPRLYAPAMNPEMWRNEAVARSVALLDGDGWRRIGPSEGDTACGERGAGRMAEPAEIRDAVLAALASGDS